MLVEKHTSGEKNAQDRLRSYWFYWFTSPFIALGSESSLPFIEKKSFQWKITEVPLIASQVLFTRDLKMEVFHLHWPVPNTCRKISNVPEVTLRKNGQFNPTGRICSAVTWDPLWWQTQPQLEAPQEHRPGEETTETALEGLPHRRKLWYISFPFSSQDKTSGWSDRKESCHNFTWPAKSQAACGRAFPILGRVKVYGRVMCLAHKKCGLQRKIHV